MRFLKKTVNFTRSCAKSQIFRVKNVKKKYLTHPKAAKLATLETWTVTQTLENQIDSCHRRLLREAIEVHYPKIITTEEIYRVTKAEPWSRVIKRRRLRWLGHVMRLEDDTPAKQALQDAPPLHG